MTHRVGPAVLVGAALMLGTASPSVGQQPSERCDTAVVVDRIVAVVGDAAVMASQVEEEAFQQRGRSGGAPQTPEQKQAICKSVLEEIINSELLLQQASRDTTIKVTDEEVAEGVEEQIKNVRARFQSEAEYRVELQRAGFQTPEEYRRWLTDQQRRAALQNRLLEQLRSDQKLPTVIPTEREMREAFEAQKEQINQLPTLISFREIVIGPKPSQVSKERALALADSIVTELRKGADFATAAKRFSQDPGTKEQGGELNWFRRGAMLPEFEQVAFMLKPGVISDPVETPFGYHIIQVQRVQPAEIQARHILIVPEVTPGEADSAKALAEQVRQQVLDGAPFDSLQRLYHDQTEEKSGDNIPWPKLPEPFQKAIGEADSGQVVPIFTIPGTVELAQKYVVFEVTGRRSPGEVRFEDVKDQIRRRLEQELAVRRYIEHLRSITFVEIRS